MQGADRIGIEFISVFGQDPVELVHLAGDLGCRHVSMALAPMYETPLRLPPWSLRDDAALRERVAEALRDRDVSISLGEGFMIWPRADVRDARSDFDTMVELGVRRVNACCLEPDAGRGLDQLAAFVEMADAAGLDSTLEWGPLFSIPDLPAALAAVRHVGSPNFRLLVDTLHLSRAGLGAKDLEALDPGLIGYLQLCDAPAAFTPESYMKEAQFERMAPGEGELPLAEVVAALPRDVLIGLEVPMLSEAQAGRDARARLGRCVDATRALLEKLDAPDAHRND